MVHEKKVTRGTSVSNLKDSSTTTNNLFKNDIIEKKSNFRQVNLFLNHKRMLLLPLLKPISVEFSEVTKLKREHSNYYKITDEAKLKRKPGFVQLKRKIERLREKTDKTIEEVQYDSFCKMFKVTKNTLKGSKLVTKNKKLTFTPMKKIYLSVQTETVCPYYLSETRKLNSHFMRANQDQ